MAGLRMSRTAILVAASALAAVGAVGGVAGCSSSSSGAKAPATTSIANSNAGLSGEQLLSAFRSAVATGTAVHVVGSISQPGTNLALDLHLDKSGTSSGSVSQAGVAVPFRAVNGATYIQLTPALLKQEAATDPSITPGVISLVENKWVSSQSSIGKSIASSFNGLTDYNAFLATIESGGSSASAATGSASSAPLTLADLTADGTTSYNGGTVAVYKSADGSTAYFAASGPAYLEKVTATGSEPGTLALTWNEPVAVTAPPSSDIFTG